MGGYAIVTHRKNGAFEVQGHGSRDCATNIADDFYKRDDSFNAFVIDLSTIRKDQLVKPEPKTETRKVRFAVLRNGGLAQWTGPFPNDTTSPNIIAFIEREIEFTHGEGLGQELPS